MYRHEYFNLYLHDDAELRPMLQSDIVERVTLHEWPLSCVQRLSTSDGQNIIYKTQYGPTVEAEFYANAVSDLLISGETIYHSGGHVCMLLECIDAPSLKDLAVSEGQAVDMGRSLLVQLRGIRGDLPVYLDVSSEAKWVALVKTTLETLTMLVNQGQFRAVDAEHIARLERWALAAPALAAVRQSPGYVHGDLGSDNLFVLPSGHRVIDWQRTKLGPTELDLVTLLESLGFDPLGHVDENIVWMAYLLRINWFCQCTLRWFPEGKETYDRSVAHLASLVGTH